MWYDIYRIIHMYICIYVYMYIYIYIYHRYCPASLPIFLRANKLLFGRGVPSGPHGTGWLAGPEAGRIGAKFGGNSPRNGQTLGIFGDLNMFAPTRTLLHTYNRHHHHHHNHHLDFHEGSKFATPYEQYVDWGNSIKYISMRDLNSPPSMNNMLTGVITLALSSWGIKIRNPLWTICWLE